MNKLFIYGTLAPGKENHDVMQNIPGTWEPATIKGKLIKQGWGAVHGCPGVIPDSRAEDIRGYLFTSDALPEYWAALDRFEGGDYERVVVSVGLGSGEQVDACVYAIHSALQT